MQLLEFSYNDHLHKVMGMCLLEMKYGKSPIALATIGTPQKGLGVVEFLLRMQDSLPLSKTKLQQVVDRAKCYVD